MNVAYAADEFFPKINGVYHKMLGGRATTESANDQDQPVQSATTATICSTGNHSCYHLSKNQVKIQTV